MDYRVISIGTLSCHELWDPNTPMRTCHATTTLIRSGSKIILVDPGLPAQVVTARVAERAGLEPHAITDVFLTNFRPAHRAGLAEFEHANWLISELERETIGQHLFALLHEQSDEAGQLMIQQEIDLLKQLQPAPDKLADQVDLFPLPGFTPGTCGLLLSHLDTTTLIAGDAVATSEHLQSGRVLRGCFDTELARQSLTEAIEIADVIVPGHDNLVLNPTRHPI